VFSLNIANLPQNAAVKEFSESVNIWQIYRHKLELGGLLFGPPCMT